MTKKLMIGTGLVTGMLAFSGCTFISPKPPVLADTQAKQFTTTKGKSNIYVYRNESYGGSRSMPILLGEEHIGTTFARTYLKISTKPGTHVLTSHTENIDTLVLNTKANKNYFVWQEVKMGLVNARSKLKLVSEVEGKKGVKECEMILQ